MGTSYCRALPVVQSTEDSFTQYPLKCILVAVDRCCIHHRRLPGATLNKVCGSVNDLCGPVDSTSAYKAEEAAFQAHLVRPKWVFSF